MIGEAEERDLIIYLPFYLTKEWTIFFKTNVLFRSAVENTFIFLLRQDSPLIDGGVGEEGRPLLFR